MDQGGYLKTITNKLHEFSQKNILCDTTLVTSDREFTTHSVILAAASPILKSVFQNSAEAGNTYRIELLGLDGATMESILLLIYTGSLKSSVTVSTLDESATLVMTCEQLGLDWIWSQVDLSRKSQAQCELHDPQTVHFDVVKQDDNKECSDNSFDESISHPFVILPKAMTVKSDGQPLTTSSAGGEMFDHLGFVKNEIKTSEIDECLLVSFTAEETCVISTLQPFVCDLCDKRFEGGDQLKSHRFIHTSRLDCSECGRKFKYAASLRKHEENHKDAKDIMCHVCGIVCYGLHQLKLHITEHHAGDITGFIFCDICQDIFPDEAKLEKHSCSHIKSRPYACSRCYKSFNEKGQLKKHLAIHEYGKEHVCDVCNRGFRQEYYLKKHIRTHCNTMNYVCTTCGKRFKLLDYLKVHKKGHCPAEEDDCLLSQDVDLAGEECKSHKCQTCDRVFSHLNYLKKHMRMHIGEKPYVCNICGKAFKDNRIQQHMLMHNSERPFACEKCGKSFSRQADLQAHVRTHSGHKKHWCSLCIRGFHKKSDLHRHLRIHTGERPYVCETCGKSFKILFHLRIHSYVHSTDRPHKCDTCGKAFSSTVRLKKHQYIHSGVRPYGCPICQRHFNRLANMKSHLKTHKNKSINFGVELGNGNEMIQMDEDGNLTASSDNVEIIYCKVEQPDVLVAMPMDVALQRYSF